MCIKHPKRNTFMTRHHILPRHRKGKSIPSNTLKIWRDKHDALHVIFGNQTLDEVMYDMHWYHCKFKHTKAWNVLFKDMSLYNIVKLFERTMKIKHTMKCKKG